MKTKKLTILSIALMGIMALGCYACKDTSTTDSEQSPTADTLAIKQISDIPVPDGYQRVSAGKGSYADYLRSLPLKPQGTQSHLWNGDPANIQSLVGWVVDQDMYSRYEECADVVMRLRAEYLWANGKYDKIAYHALSGHQQQYQGGASHDSLKHYLCEVYKTSNTTSMYNETKPRKFKDIQIGDIFVYRSSDHNSSVGHAMVVVDLATNSKGEKAFMCVEGFLPACEKHVVRNYDTDGTWFFLNDNDSSVDISGFEYNTNQLRYY